MLYFAYGSNMSWDQMRSRCPSSRFIGTGLLPDHRLAFTRKSVNRGCGVADAVVELGREVWGVVYEINDHEVGLLDTSEGYNPGREQNSYFRHERLVLLDGEGERPVTVAVYFAEPQPNPPLPNAEYKNLILFGARYWHLPEGYMDQLAQIETLG